MSIEDTPEEKIFIGDKTPDRYVTACLVALNNNKNILHLIGRGNNIKRVIDVADIMIRKHLDIQDKIPTLSELEDSIDNDDINYAKKLVHLMKSCEIIIGSEQYQNRYVSTIDIYLRGKRKNVILKSV